MLRCEQEFAKLFESLQQFLREESGLDIHERLPLDS